MHVGRKPACVLVRSASILHGCFQFNFVDTESKEDQANYLIHYQYGEVDGEYRYLSRSYRPPLVPVEIEVEYVDVTDLKVEFD